VASAEWKSPVLSAKETKVAAYLPARVGQVVTKGILQATFPSVGLPPP